MTAKNAAGIAISGGSPDAATKAAGAYKTASVYLKQLVDIGVLEETTSGKEKLFVNAHLMKLMTSS